MVDEVITKQELIDAQKDAQSLEEVVNGNDAKQVTTRLGESYPSVKKAIKTLFENGGLPATPFATKALMTASALVNGEYAVVTDDVVSANGLYIKVNNNFVKSRYDSFEGLLRKLRESSILTQNDDDSLGDKPNIYNKEQNISGKYINNSSTNTIQSASLGAALYKLSVKYGQKIVFRGANYSSNMAISFGDHLGTTNGTVLTKASVSVDGGVAVVVVPSGVTDIYFNTHINSVNFDIRDTLIVNVIEPEISSIDGMNIRDNSAISKSGTSLVGIESLVSQDDIVEGYYISTAASSKGLILSSTVSKTALALFPVKIGNKYSIRAKDTRDTIFSVRGMADSSVANLKQTKEVLTTEIYGGVVVTPSEGVNYLVFNVAHELLNFDIVDDLWVGEGDKINSPAITKIDGVNVYDADLRESIERGIVNAGSKLKNKSWAVIGDSISVQPSIYINKGYAMLISDKVGGMKLSKFADGGIGYYYYDSLLDRFTPFNNKSYDYITVFWGTNDWALSSGGVLGEFLDSPGSGTISGNINKTLNDIINKNLTAKIGVITPLPRANNYGLNALPNNKGFTLKDVVDLIIKYCEHYSIPCLDLYRLSGLPVYTEGGNALYFTAKDANSPDGLHPNDLGHEVIASKIQSFLESL